MERVVPVLVQYPLVPVVGPIKLPVTVNDPPIPTFPVILALPQTSSLLLLVVAPTPTFPEKVWLAVQVLALPKFKEATTAPVVGEMVNDPSELETVDMAFVTVEVNVNVPPKETEPPPDNPVPVEIVTDELDNAELPILLKVLLDPDIVLFVNV